MENAVTFYKCYIQNPQKYVHSSRLILQHNYICIIAPSDKKQWSKKLNDDITAWL